MLGSALSIIAPLAMIPASEALVIIATIFVAGFVAWQSLKILARGVGQLSKLVKESSKTTVTK
jgi:hypothetical protein